MNADYYRLIGFIDLVTAMLEEKDLASPNPKRTPVSLQRQLTSARKVLVGEALKLQRANAEFKINVQAARDVIADVLAVLHQGTKSLDPLVSAHFAEFSDASVGLGENSPHSQNGQVRRLGGGDDCSTSIKPVSSSTGTSSSSSVYHSSSSTYSSSTSSPYSSSSGYTSSSTSYPYSSSTSSSTKR